MPRASWGINAEDIDGYDRSRDYAPYTGPIPPNSVYRWKLKKLSYQAASGTSKPQMIIGLELIPRSKEEKRYAGFFCMVYRSISPNNAFTYVPFLDALGVSGREFQEGTKVDGEGNILSMGRWRNNGNVHLMGQLVDDEYEKNGAVITRKTCKWFGPDQGDVIDDSDDGDDFDDGYADDGEAYGESAYDDDGYDDEETPF